MNSGTSIIDVPGELTVSGRTAFLYTPVPTRGRWKGILRDGCLFMGWCEDGGESIALLESTGFFVSLSRLAPDAKDRKIFIVSRKLVVKAGCDLSTPLWTSCSLNKSIAELIFSIEVSKEEM